jgi:hypothetical protein
LSFIDAMVLTVLLPPYCTERRSPWRVYISSKSAMASDVSSMCESGRKPRA